MAGRKPTDPRSDIPDLDIPATPSRAPGRGSASRAPGASRASRRPGSPSSPDPGAAAPSGPPDPLDYFGGATFEANDGGVLLDLDTGTPGGRAGATDPGDLFGSASFDADSDLASGFDVLERSDAAAMGSIQTATRRGPARKWPTGVSPSPAAHAIDRGILSALADYGKPPASALLSSPYAYRVLTRKRVLRARVKDLEARLEDRERARDEELARLGERIRSQLPARGFEEALANVAHTDRAVAERRQALSGTNADYDQRVSNLAAELADADRKRQEVSETRAARARAADERRQELGRVEARHRRCFIELRPFAELVERGQALSPAQASKVAELEAQAARISQELAAAREGLRAAEVVLSAIDRELEGIEKRRADVERRRRALDAEFRKKIGSKSAELEGVELERSRALADVGRRVLAERGNVPVDDATLDRLIALDAAVAEVAADLDRYVGALDCYDPDAVKRGAAVAAALVVALVLLVVVLAS